MLAGLLLATACSADNETGSATSSSGADTAETFGNGLIGVEPATGDPQPGGTLEIKTFGEARSLDPAEIVVNGTSGGIETAAIYDTLLRYDPGSGEYEPWLAESMEPDADHRTWTMTLREGVTFSDGAPLDAEAVLWSIERYVSQDGDQASLWTTNVASVEPVDPRTVRFELTAPWPEFEYLLATGPGMVVAKSSEAGGEFRPIGAGPFVLERMAAQEELVLAANPTYWRGAPPLEQLQFVNVVGDPPKVDLLRLDQADVAYLRKPDAVTDAREAGVGGLMEINSLGESLLLNHRDGAATADPRVRRALSLAIDRDFINQRVYGGEGIPQTGIFSERSALDTGSAADGFDRDRAVALLEEAKADGYDGTISFLGVATGSESVALALKALLENVGFTVELDYVNSPADLVQQIYVKQDYEMAIWGFGFPDGAVYPELYESFHSESSSNVGAYADPSMDELIDDLQSATTDAHRQRIAIQMQEVWNETTPAIPLLATPEFVAWQATVHDVVPSIDGLVLLGTAWQE